MIKSYKTAIYMLVWMFMLVGTLWWMPYNSSSKVNVFVNLEQPYQLEGQDVSERIKAENLIDKMYALGCQSVFIQVISKANDAEPVTYIGDPRHIIKDAHFKPYDYSFVPSKVHLFCILKEPSEYSKTSAAHLLQSMGYTFDYVDDLQGEKWVFRVFMMIYLTCCLHILINDTQVFERVRTYPSHSIITIALKVILCGIWLYGFNLLIGYERFFKILRVFLNDDLLLLLSTQLKYWHHQIGIGVWSHMQMTILYIAVNLIFLLGFIRIKFCRCQVV